jgi:membrane fusion protein (multidrug efflux system)
MAGLNLSYCTVVSPISGIVGAALQQEGAFVSSANSSLTTVAVLSPMWVNFSISENEMQRYHDEVKAGRLVRPKNHNYDVEIVLVNGSVFPHPGRLTFAAPSYSAQTGTFLLRASVDNPQGELRPNQFVRVRLKGAIRPKSITIPQRAIQQGAKGHYVWVVTKDGKAKLRPVTVGDWYGNDIFISEGLRAGDQVVVDGGLTLHPDEQVVAKPVGQGGPPPAARVPSAAGTARKSS